MHNLISKTCLNKNPPNADETTLHFAIIVPFKMFQVCGFTPWSTTFCHAWFNLIGLVLDHQNSDRQHSFDQRDALTPLGLSIWLDLR